jgi:hypothetical protein
MSRQSFCIFWLVFQFRHHVLSITHVCSIRTSVQALCNGVMSLSCDADSMLLHNYIATSNLVGRFDVAVKSNPMVILK